MPILISRQTLAERWDFDSPQSIIKYEQLGIITRVPGLPSPRYSIDEIERIESIGFLNPLSPLERKRFEKRVIDLESELNFYKDKFENIKNIVI